MQDTIIKEFSNLQAVMKKRFNEVRCAEKEINASEQDILHFIEFEKYNAVVGAKVLKQLKIIRNKRRIIKDEIQELTSCMTKLDNIIKKNKPNKMYRYKTAIIEKIMAG